MCGNNRNSVGNRLIQTARGKLNENLKARAFRKAPEHSPKDLFGDEDLGNWSLFTFILEDNLASTQNPGDHEF